MKLTTIAILAAAAAGAFYLYRRSRSSSVTTGTAVPLGGAYVGTILDPSAWGSS